MAEFIVTVVIMFLFLFIYFSVKHTTKIAIEDIDLERKLINLMNKVAVTFYKKIDDDFEKYETKTLSLKSTTDALTVSVSNLNDEVDKLKNKLNCIKDLETEIRKLNAIIHRKNKQIERLKNEGN
jgi:peptidoglycan hydrolase CwlO-like protein